MNLSFWIPGKAQTAGSKRAFLLKRRDGSFVRRRDGSPIVNVTDDNPKANDWKGDVKRFVSEEYTGPLLDAPLEVTFTFYVARPKFHFNKRGLKDNAPRFPDRKPDLLKLARAVEDAMTGVIYADDSQIVTELLKKRFVDGPLIQPGVLIEIQWADLLLAEPASGCLSPRPSPIQPSLIPGS